MTMHKRTESSGPSRRTIGRDASAAAIVGQALEGARRYLGAVVLDAFRDHRASSQPKSAVDPWLAAEPRRPPMSKALSSSIWFEMSIKSSIPVTS